MEESKPPIKKSNFLNLFFFMRTVHQEGFGYYSYFLGEQPVGYPIGRKEMQPLRCAGAYFVNPRHNCLLALSMCVHLFIHTFELNTSVINPIKCTLTQKKNMLNTSFLKILHASGKSLPSVAVFPRGTNPSFGLLFSRFHSTPRQIKSNPGRENMLVSPGSIF